MKNLIAVLLLLFASVSLAAAQNIQSYPVIFGADDEFRGYLAKPIGNGPFPGLIVIHEWWGLNDNIKAETDKLAKAGYAALAVDLFRKSTTDPEEASKMVKSVDQKKANQLLVSAAGYLRAFTYVDDDRVGSIGWCFGGRQSLMLAINDPALAAAVIYYGKPITEPNELSKIQAPILGIFGEADDSIPMSDVNAFKQTLKDLKIRNEIYTYPGAGHAFANPTRGDSYKSEAAEDAWKKTLAFLESTLKKPKSCH